jgi:hypothetical protein
LNGSSKFLGAGRGAARLHDGLRESRAATDRVQASPKPESWNIGPLLRVAVILGMIMLVEALGLLAVGWRWFDLGADAGRLQTFTFETLLFFALFSMISVRERRAFWSSMPSAALSSP